MVWPVAFSDSAKLEVTKICHSKGLFRPHDPAIFVRRIVDDYIRSQQSGGFEEVLLGGR